MVTTRSQSSPRKKAPALQPRALHRAAFYTTKALLMGGVLAVVWARSMAWLVRAMVAFSSAKRTAHGVGGGRRGEWCRAGGGWRRIGHGKCRGSTGACRRGRRPRGRRRRECGTRGWRRGSLFAVIGSAPCVCEKGVHIDDGKAVFLLRWYRRRRPTER